MAQKDFYVNLYAEKNNQTQNNVTEFLSKIHMPKIMESTKSRCDEVISEREVLEVFSKLANNKTPGLDSFNVEFYQFFATLKIGAL